MATPEAPEAKVQLANDEQPAVRVRAATKIIERGSDLLAVAKDRRIAIKLINWETRVFRDSEGPVTMAEIVAVDLSGPVPKPLGVVQVGWSRILRLLEIAEPGSWQVGTLTKQEGEQGAVELEPPGEELDLTAIALTLGELQLARSTTPKQLQVPTGETASGNAAGGGDFEPPEDDHIPFHHQKGHFDVAI